jgi:hypothetical protein
MPLRSRNTSGDDAFASFANWYRTPPFSATNQREVSLGACPMATGWLKAGKAVKMGVALISGTWSPSPPPITTEYPSPSPPPQAASVASAAIQVAARRIVSMIDASRCVVPIFYQDCRPIC